MKTIEYKVVFSDGSDELVRVPTRTINSGFAKVLKRAKEPLGNTVVREISSISFWRVVGF